MKKFDLNIGKILEDWEIYHAIREIIANALDEQLLTNTAEIEISKIGNVWCIRDFGRGLNYHHLMQNENPEKTENDKVIGRFGVGLKDALATLFRHNINVETQSKHGTITLKETTKNTFEDIITLHAQIDSPINPKMNGTVFNLYGCPDDEINKAKRMFLQFSNEKIIEKTSYGQVIAKTSDIANIYINGVKVAEESNFAFSYNITALSKQIKKALNRERTNVGRTAYAERIKSILLESNSKDVLSVLSANLEVMSDGTQCDEIKWVDVAAHAVQVLNDSDNTVFVTPDELANSSGSTSEILYNSGKRIVFIPENVKQKAEQETDGKISTISAVVKEYNESFSYTFVDVQQLTKVELANWNKLPDLLNKLELSSWFEKCFIAEQIKENPNNTVGVWDRELQKIIILRSQLQNAADLFGTVIHEIIHATTGATDISRYFECKLTDMIGKLSSMNLCRTSDDNIDDKRNGLIIGFDSDSVDDIESQNCYIDTRRLALLSISGDVSWCDDSFGFLSSYTKQILERRNIADKNEPFKRKCAVYVEENVSYWLMYNYSNKSDIDFLVAIAMNDIKGNMFGKGTIYTEEQIRLLRDYMKTDPSIFTNKYNYCKVSTYDGYLLINRNFLLQAEPEFEKENKNSSIWMFAEKLRHKSDVLDRDLEKYINNHICPKCGCYFTGFESKCVKCGNCIINDGVV